MYKINDYVVYRRNVCIVKEVKEKYFNDIDYYILEPLTDKSLKIQVPINVSNKYLRDIISKKEVEELINKIPDISIIENNDRLMENEYKKLMSTGKHEDLIAIIKTTYLRNKERQDNNKKVGEKDNNFFLQAEKSLYEEFSISLNKSYEDTKKYVIDKVNKLTK